MKNFLKFISIFSILAISGCTNPLGDGNSKVDPGYDTGGGGTTTRVSMNVPFTAGSEASYHISDTTQVEFLGGVTRLKSANQKDQDNTASGFGPSTLLGATWNSSPNFIRLDTTTNTAELDPSWTPEWNHIVGYWKMNGTPGSVANGSVIPATVGTNGTAVTIVGGGLSYTTGRMNGAMSFLANKDVVRVSSSLPISNKFTFSFWIYLTDFPATISAPLSASLAGVLKWEFFFNVAYVLGGYPAYGINMFEFPGSTRSGTSANTFTMNDLAKWHHIAVVFDSSAVRKTKFYKDGRLLQAGSDAMSLGFPAHDALWIGGYRSDGNACCSTNGKTDEVAVWDTALTDQEVATIYNRQSALYAGQITSRVMDAFSTRQTWSSISATTSLPFYKELTASSSNETSANYSDLQGDTPAVGDNNLTTNLVGLWHLNESEGTSGVGSVNDSSGSNHNGTPTNVDFGTPGRLGSGAYFSGASMVAIANSADINNTGGIATTSAWINTTSKGVGIIFSAYDGTNGYEIYVDASGNAAAWSDTGLGYSGVAVDDGAWHQITAVWDGTNVNLYVDGKLNGSAARTFHAQTLDNQIGAACVAAGSTSCVSNFNGRIDEVAVWKKALNSTEVLQLYRRGANRLKYQIRTCTAADCSDQDALTSSGRGWKGADNTQVTYFSELQNNTSINSSGEPTGAVNAGALNLSFPAFATAGTGLSVSNNRYFQYRAILESDDQNSLCTYGGASKSCSPELKVTAIGPDHYDPTAQSVTSKASLGMVYTTLDANGFTETGGTCSSGLRYALSSDGITYYYWNGSSWAASSNYSTASSASTVSANLASFSSTAGAGTLQIKTFLKSDGTSSCQIDNLAITGNH